MLEALQKASRHDSIAMEVATRNRGESGLRKRKKMSQEERVVRSRERNRVHARKTRARKKQQAEALQYRIGELKTDGDRLRQMVDERYTASVLLGMSRTIVTQGDGTNEEIEIQSSKSICGNAYADLMANPRWYSGADGDNMSSSASTDATQKKRRSKYSPQERDKIRRERNRMHAKRTRDRKKMFLEASENVISNMETESYLLRSYLVNIGAMKSFESKEWDERDRLRRLELSSLTLQEAEEDEDALEEMEAQQAADQATNMDSDGDMLSLDEEESEGLAALGKASKTSTRTSRSPLADSAAQKVDAKAVQGATVKQDTAKQQVPQTNTEDDVSSEMSGSGSGDSAANQGSTNGSSNGSSNGDQTSAESSGSRSQSVKNEEKAVYQVLSLDNCDGRSMSTMGSGSSGGSDDGSGEGSGNDSSKPDAHTYHNETSSDMSSEDGHIQVKNKTLQVSKDVSDEEFRKELIDSAARVEAATAMFYSK